MKAISFVVLCALAATLLPDFSPPLYADTVSLPLRQGHVAFTMGGLNPMRALLGPGQLIGIKKEPADLVDPYYASITLGPKEQKTTYNIILEEVPGKPPRLLVDANHDGDLTNDPPAVWRKGEYLDFKGHKLIRMEASVTVQVPYGKTTLPLKLLFVRLDPKDPNYGALQDVLLYMADYVREGPVTLGKETYQVTLLDAVASGDFRGNYSKDLSGTLLLIDVNGNGIIDGQGEIYDLAKPFNIKGTTYELHVLNAIGDKIELVKSKETVAEIPPPPFLKVGKPALPFKHKTLDGKTVNFPEDYRGKLVLLYFWADWCPDCANELPNVLQVYELFHPQGLEILGASIEADDHEKELTKFVQDNKMPWTQTYDGKIWQGTLAQLYYVLATPTPFLVDGDTGKILAMRDDLIGPALPRTIAKALAAKKH